LYSVAEQAAEKLAESAKSAKIIPQDLKRLRKKALFAIVEPENHSSGAKAPLILSGVSAPFGFAQGRLKN
jgi:hypothetical protein